MIGESQIFHNFITLNSENNHYILWIKLQ